MNIILIGMPSSGKSTLGVILAKTLCMEFVDTDLILQKKYNKPLQAIINEEGLQKFLEYENDTLEQLNVQNTVIATGGSAVLSSKAMEHLKLSGKVVYIKLNYSTIKKRLKNIKTRGIAMKKGESLFDLYNYRLPYYEKYADITVECDYSSVENSVEKILTAINLQEK